jgi:predicted membrane protein
MDEDRWERRRQRWEQRWERRHERWERRQARWQHPGKNLFAGFVFVAIGLIFLLGNLGYLNVHAVIRFWPVILIAAGVVKLVESGDDFRTGSGVFWIVVGSLFLLGSLDIVRITMRELWPVVLIGVGALMLWRASMARQQRESWATGGNGGRAETDPPVSSNSVLSATAILGGFKKLNNSQDFRGGDATAIMGGGQIDLRAASITSPHEPVLEVFAMWGGIEIRVPPDWTVLSRVDPILGGYDDKTIQPKDESKRFVIRGTVVMGGIEVRN